MNGGDFHCDRSHCSQPCRQYLHARCTNTCGSSPAAAARRRPCHTCCLLTMLTGSEGGFGGNRTSDEVERLILSSLNQRTTTVERGRWREASRASRGGGTEGRGGATALLAIWKPPVAIGTSIRKHLPRLRPHGLPACLFQWRKISVQNNVGNPWVSYKCGELPRRLFPSRE